MQPLAAKEPLDNKVASSPELTASPSPGDSYRIQKVGPGWTSRLQLWILKRATEVLRAAGSQRFYPMIWLVGKAFRRRNHVHVQIQDQCDMRIGLSDPYWMCFVLNQQQYEPELRWLFDAVSREHRGSTLLVDCGANVGWCSLVASKQHRFHAIAVEPSMHLVEQLEYNKQLNGASFNVVRQAIWNKDDQPLSFLTGLDAHAGGHLKEVAGFVPNWRVSMEQQVTTVKVDSLVDQWKREHPAADDLLVVIKVDVEGAEAQAMEGSARTLDDYAILMYEDHGSDQKCEATAAALAQGLIVFSLGDTGGLRAVDSIEQARSIKVFEYRGYNFVAAKKGSKGEDFLRRLQGRAG